MNIDKDWQALSETWQAQPDPGIDVAAVRREVTQRGRWLRLKLWGEVAMVVLFSAFCLWVVLRQESDLFEKILFSSMGVVLVVYQSFIFWMRRDELSDAGLDVHSLVDLELRRAHTTLRYWRYGMWVATAIWVALYAVMMVGVYADWPRQNVAGVAGGLIGNIVVMPMIGLFGYVRCRQELARIARYRDLQAQLRAP